MALTWLDGCIHKKININYTKGLAKTGWDGIGLHVAGSEAQSLYGWFCNPVARASSHFYVRRDGTIEQYVSVRDRSWTSGAGSDRLLGIETQGTANGQWTDAQVKSIVWLIKTLAKEFGFPIRQMASSKKSERGIGYHALGVPANATQKARGVSQTGGELWSSAVGKVCPGPDRVKQIPGIVAMAGGSSAPSVEKPKVTDRSVKCVDTKAVSVKNLQERLKSLGFYGSDWVVDGIDGDATKNAILSYQRSQRYHPNLTSDGFWGPLEEKHYQWVKTFQNAINQWKTSDRLGKTKIDGDFGNFASKLTLQTQKDNLRGKYQEAVQSIYGRGYTAVADGIPGKAFCKMLGISPHPSA